MRPATASSVTCPCLILDPRAYIAASRRSDRSLEARIQSARRASEIHKARTGRSLKVTEQDVLNEEMYDEKEDEDDLLTQCRRLTAHLQTKSIDFNRRLAAYLTSQVATRSAMEQTVDNQYNRDHYTNAAQFAGQGQHSLYESHITNHTISPTMTSSYRSAPYPSPHQPVFRQMHGRANSMAAPNELASSRMSKSPLIRSQSQDGRRMSTPLVLPSAHPVPMETGAIKPDPEYQRQTQSATFGQFPSMYQDMGPFTTSLPPESQQLLAGTMDPNDPFTSSLMAGSETFLSNPYYPWHNMQGSGKMGQMNQIMHPSYNSLSATLAPCALDNGTKTASASTGTSAPSDDSASASGFDFQLFQETNTKGLYYPESPGVGSGQVTPAEGFWDSFVEDAYWIENNNSSSRDPTHR